MSDIGLIGSMIAIHLAGFLIVGILMLPTMDDTQAETDPDDGRSNDDGWGNQPQDGPRPTTWPGGGLPLPDAEQSRIRLREPGRLSDHIERRRRQPERAPDPRPERRPGTPVPSRGGDRVTPGHGRRRLRRV